MQRDRQREGIEGSGGECAYVIQGGAGGIFNGEEGERNFLGRGQRVRRGGEECPGRGVPGWGQNQCFHP